MRERFARWSLVTFAAVVLLVLAGTAGAVAEPGGRAAAASEPASSYSVTLITGDQVHLQVFPDGRQAAIVDPAPRGEGLPEPSFQTLEVDGDAYVFPSDAALYLDEKLDRELFNVSELVAQGFDDEASASLPVILDYERTVGTLPPAMVEEEVLESIDARAAREPRGKAAAFGRALAEQARRDAQAGGRGGRAAPAEPGLFAGIEKIWLDEKVEATLAESVPQIGAPVAWVQGFDGGGVTVAVLDTGIDASHPDLVGKVVDARNFTTSPTESDRFGHGTHVASTIAGSGAASSGARKGVAPGASLLNGKVLGDNGSGPTSGVIAGMEWAARDKGADVVNVSLGAGPTDGTDPLSQAVNSLTAQYGTLFAISAGNAGPGSQSVGAPGAASSALTVGAVDKSDALASSSSRGPRRGDFAIKPDITAPGVAIVAARAAGTSLGTPLDQHYTILSGTSMAAPHVAGAAALLAQRHPDWGPEELKAALVTTASPGPYTVYQQGGGRVDVARTFTQAPVLATPAPLDLGFFPWPHEDTAPVTKTVTYSNLSDQELTLDLALDVRDKSGVPALPGGVTVAPAQLTLPAGASQQVEVTVDPTVGDPGLYGGYLVAQSSDEEVVLSTPLGFYKEPATYDLTVEAIERNGEPAFGLSNVQVMNVEDLALFRGSGSFRPGPLTFRVPAGTYSVMGFIFTCDGSRICISDPAVVGRPEIEVNEDRTVTLDARTANEIVPQTKEETEPVWLQLAWRRASEAGPGVQFSFSFYLLADQAFAAPTEAISKGEFEFYSGWRLVAPGTAPRSSSDPLLSPYVFDLVLPERDRIPESLRYVIEDDDVATIHTSFYSQVGDGTVREGRVSFRPYTTIGAAGFYAVPVPTTRVDYVSANDNSWWQQVHPRTSPSSTTQFFDAFTSYEGEGGEELDQEWLKQPVRPGVDALLAWQPPAPAYREGDILYLFIPEFVDAGGHSGFRHVFTDTTAFRLYQDDELVAEGERADGHFPMGPERATYRLELDVARDAEWWRLSTRTATSWTFGSERPMPGSQAILPLLAVDYDLNLDLLNRLPLPQEGRGDNAIELAVHHQRGAPQPPIGGARLWVSFDDGTSWKEKRVQPRGGGRFRVVLDQRDFEETSGFVSLRVEAWDAGDNRIEQEITRAYALKPRQ